MRILMSIQTKYARKIFSGRKGWEFRKAVPRIASDSLFPITIVVYSAGEDRAVIGEFTVGRVLRTSFSDLMTATGMSDDSEAVEWLSNYYADRATCSAIEVDAARLYANPIPLSQIRGRVPSFRPPQNFVYLGNFPELESALGHADA